MRILHISSEIRHELGCAASLSLRGYDVTYLHLGEKNLPHSKRLVHVDEGNVWVPMLGIKSPTLLKSITSPSLFIPLELRNEHFDMVVTTPSAPFYIAYQIAKRQQIPLLLRVWGIRAAKLINYIVNGKSYTEIYDFYPSTLHNLLQIWSSNASVVLDDATMSFLRRIPTIRKLFTVYPTYAAFREPQEENEKYWKVLDMIEKGEYIFSIVTSDRTGVAFKIQEYNLLAILYYIALNHPELNIIIAGATEKEVKSKILVSPPSNITFVGKIYSDDLLRALYDRAKLVIIPVFFKSVSNRLLEALYYGKPILTNSTAKLIHNKLEHRSHIFISDNYREYPQIVKALLKDEALLEQLSLGAKDAYSSYFSARRCGLLMKHIVEMLLP